MTPGQRDRLVKTAMRWCEMSVAWAALAGASSLVTGLATSSVALVGFGASSALDGTASAVLVWRFRHERSVAGVDAVERRAAFAVAIVMIAVAVYLTASAVGALADRSGPEKSSLGVILTAASVLVLPVLARAKLRLAAPLQSPGLRGDGVLSLAGALLAAATLVSRVLDSALDWWWADAVAAVVISAVLLTEGWRTIARARSLSR